MYGTYLRLNVTVYDSWRTVIRAAARKLTRAARHDPRQRDARRWFYRKMLEYHAGAQRIVRLWRL